MPYCAYCGHELPGGAIFCPSCGKPVDATIPSSPSSTTTTAITNTSRPTDIASSSALTPSQQQLPTTRPAYAGEFDRMAAVIIDTIIVAVIMFVLLIPFGFARIFFGPSFFFGFALLIFWLFWLGYFTYFEMTTGQTLGKQILHIRVVDETSLKRLDFGPALIRNIFRIIDWLPFLYIIGILAIAIDRRKRRLGDMVAHSIVVKTHPPGVY